MKNVKTIGYAGFTDFASFIAVLKNHNVTDLIDVRSVPRSQYFTAFNDSNLQRELPKYGIAYQSFKTEFGARVENLIYYTNGVVDFEKFAQSPEFNSGIQKIEKLIGDNKNICLMCAEIDPINCHRAILCGRNFAKHNINVEHIIAKRNGEVIIETQEQVEKRLQSKGG